MNVWLLVTILATSALPQSSPPPGATPEFAADSLGNLGLPNAGGAPGGSLFAGFS